MEPYAPTALNALLHQNTSFHWQDPTIPWAGFDREALLQMVCQVAELLHVTQDQAEHLQILFGDSLSAGKRSARPIVRAGCCTSVFSATGQIVRNIIVFNRARQGALASELLASTEHFLCPLATSKEVLLWLFIEEIKHAQMKWQLKTMQHLKQWRAAYRHLLALKLSPVPSSLDLDGEEAVVARVTVRLLASLLQDQAPDRAAFFSEIHQRSLRQRRRILPFLSRDLVEQTYLDCSGGINALRRRR